MKRPMIITIPDRLRPDAGEEVVALLPYRQGRYQRVQEAWLAEADNRAAKIDDERKQGAKNRRDLNRELRDEVDTDTSKVDPVDAVFYSGNPPHLVLAECLHSVHSISEVPSADDLKSADRMDETARAEFVSELRPGIVRFLAEELVRDAGLVDETEEERGNG